MTTSWSTASEEAPSQAHTDAEVAAEVRRRLRELGRRYYPLGIAGALLATVVGVFPSTSSSSLGSIFATIPARSSTVAPGGVGQARSVTGAGSQADAPGITAEAPYSEGAQSSTAAGFTGSTAYDDDTSTAGTYPSSPYDGTPNGNSSPGGGGTSTSSCPVPVPTTGTQIDPVLSEVASICQELSTAVPSSSGNEGLFGPSGVPGVASTSATAAPAAIVGNRSSASGVPTAWVSVDRAFKDLPYVSFAGGQGDFVALWVTQGASIPSEVSGQIDDIRHDGAAIALVLVPDTGAPGGSGSFASWAARTVGELPSAQLVGIGVAAPLSSVQVPDVVGDVVAGLGAAEHGAGPGQHVGLWWGDGGYSQADSQVWSSLVQAGRTASVLGASTFVASTVGSNGPSPCSSVVQSDLEQFQAASGRVAGLEHSALIAEIVPDSLPTSLASSPPKGCGPTGDASSSAPDGAPGPPLVVWRIGAGPLVSATGPAS